MGSPALQTSLTAVALATYDTFVLSAVERWRKASW